MTAMNIWSTMTGRHQARYLGFDLQLAKRNHPQRKTAASQACVHCLSAVIFSISLVLAGCTYR